MHVGIALNHTCGSFKEKVVRLDRHEAANDADHRRLAGDSELAPERAARVSGEMFELEPKPDHGGLAAADPKPVQVPGDLGADGDEVGGAAAEEALDAQEEEGADTAEIAVKDVAVKGMDPDRHASERRGEPAHGPGLGQMGRHDGRALAAGISVE